MLAFNLLEPRPVFLDYAARMTDRHAYRRGKKSTASSIAEIEGTQAKLRSRPRVMDRRFRQEAIALYDRFTHEGMERRDS